MLTEREVVAKNFVGPMDYRWTWVRYLPARPGSRSFDLVWDGRTVVASLNIHSDHGRIKYEAFNLTTEQWDPVGAICFWGIAKGLLSHEHYTR